MKKLTEAQERFLANPYVGTVTTLRSDGSPHNTVVWVDTENGVVRFNTAEGRAKPEHMRQDPRVAITVIDPQDTHKWISVSGRATLTHDGADAHIDRLAKKYLNEDVYPWHDPDAPRISVTIDADTIDAVGLD